MGTNYMKMLDSLMFRYVREKDLIYWPEYSRNDMTGDFRYMVCSGYYLASYTCNDTVIHIVSLGNITSCVVRHLANNQVFLTEEMAQKKADELNIIG